MAATRLIVTGHDRDGRSIFVADGHPEVTARPGGAGVAVTELFKTGAGPGAAGLLPFRLLPPSGGSVLRIVEYQPDSVRREGDHASQFREMGAPDARDPQARHFGFHRTATTDYAIVLSGEIYAVMDEGETLLRAGDILVQCATNHSWSNRTDLPVRVAFVLLDAGPEAACLV